MKKLALLTHFRHSLLAMAMLPALFGSCADGDDEYFQNQDVNINSSLSPLYGMGAFQSCTLVLPNGDRYENPFQDIKFTFGVDTVTMVATNEAIISATFRRDIPLPNSPSWQLVLDANTFSNSEGTTGKEQQIKLSSIGNPDQHFGYTLLHNGSGVYARSIRDEKVDLYLDCLTYIVTDNAHIPFGEYRLLGDLLFDIPVSPTSF